MVPVNNIKYCEIPGNSWWFYCLKIQLTSHPPRIHVMDMYILFVCLCVVN